MFVKVAAVVTLFLLLLIVNFTLHDPNCPSQRVKFVTQPSTKESCVGGDVSFMCLYIDSNGPGALPHWIINSTVYHPYDISTLPPEHNNINYVDGAELIVSNVNPNLNGTSYQCQLQLSSSSFDGICPYDSSEGQLIVVDCRAPSVQCLPIKYANGSLMGIFVNITKTSGIETNYTVNVTDSATGNDCGSIVITLSSCSSDICNDELPVPSHCSNSSALNVTVSTTAYEAVTQPLKIDAFNNFISVTIQKGSSSADFHISCTFIDAPPQESKKCNIWHGPVADNCNNLPYQLPLRAQGFNTMQVVDFNLTFLGNATRVCIALNAFSGAKSNPWEMVGIYDIAVTDDIQTPPSSTVTFPNHASSKSSSARAPVLFISFYGLVVFNCILELCFGSA